jgi:hypothetical protein
MATTDDLMKELKKLGDRVAAGFDSVNQRLDRLEAAVGVLSHELLPAAQRPRVGAAALATDHDPRRR